MSAQHGFAPHVTTLGHGPRRVLALHCTLAYSGAWGALAKTMGDEVTLIAPDMPSHGASADWDEVSDFSETVLQAALANLDAPMDVIGHSFGAAIALRLAAEHPDKIRSLTLYEPVLFHIAAQDAPDLNKAHDAEAAAYFEAFRANDMPLAARLFNRMWSPGSKWDHMPEMLRAAMIRAIHVVPATEGFLFEDDISLMPRLSTLTCPTLLLRGAETHPAVAAINDGLARRLPHAQNAVLPGAGHMGPITHARKTAELWRDLLAAT